jgi:hypothetical protein
MSSPFPGMDPFLEDPAEWPSVHTRLISAISDELAGRLAPNFYVNIEQRVYIITPDDLTNQSIAPDVYVVRNPQGVSPTPASSTITVPTLVEPQYDREIRERYLEIRDTRNREVVTTIEVISPFNKRADTQGREAFLSKRQRVMGTNVHWIELDLLRAGKRPAEVDGKSNYYALLKRGGVLGLLEVWYFDLRDRMPTIAVPLRPPFDDTPLDLQKVFDGLYARAYYADSIDYGANVPAPRLRPADAAWVQSTIKAWQQTRAANGG